MVYFFIAPTGAFSQNGFLMTVSRKKYTHTKKKHYVLKGSVKKKKRIWQNQHWTQKATVHITLLSIPAQNTALLHLRIASSWTKNPKTKYIHSSHFGTGSFLLLLLFFFTQKLQKAPKSTIESACGDRGRGQPSCWPKAGHLHKTVISYSSSKNRCVIHSSALDVVPIFTSSQY